MYLKAYIEENTLKSILLAMENVAVEICQRLRFSPSKTQQDYIHKLDQQAHDIVVNSIYANARNYIACIISEESETPVQINPGSGQFVIAVDPLDGSNNVGTNVTVGTIFSVWRMEQPSNSTVISDLICRGSDQLLAGYILYGPSTNLVLSYKKNVAMFQLHYSDDESPGFRLVNDRITSPRKGNILSINQGNEDQWYDDVRRVVKWFKGDDQQTDRPYTYRYVGSLVADFHRTLIKGGVYMYPATKRNRRGKIRFIYEIAPLSFICETAGGLSIDGKNPSLDFRPTQLHETRPVFLGSSYEITMIKKLLA